MKSSAPRRIVFLLLVFPVFLALASPLRAEDAAPAANAGGSASRASDDPLVISKGTFVRKGQSAPATIRNLVELIRERYRYANITVVGVDDVTVDNLTLQWRRVPSEKDEVGRVDPALAGVLQALAAASGRKFDTAQFSPNDFVLTPGRDPAGPGRRFAEVFNLTRFLTGNVDPNLAIALRQTQVELDVMRKRYGDKHPEVESLFNRLEILHTQIRQSARSPSEDQKRLEQIQEVVRATIEHLAPGEKPPEFQFHPGTNLLIVIGGDDAIDITRKVVAALEKNPG